MNAQAGALEQRVDALSIPYVTGTLRRSTAVSKTPLATRRVIVSYNKQRGKKFGITGTGGPKKAVKCLKDGIRKQKEASKKKQWPLSPYSEGVQFFYIALLLLA